jgi:hypothetical protein
MKINQVHLGMDEGWTKLSKAGHGGESTLALVFWSDMDDAAVLGAAGKLLQACPEAVMVGCSSGGVIQDRLLFEDSLSATLVTFEHTRFEIARAMAADHAGSHALGVHLGSALPAQSLRHVFVLSDGLIVNGDTLSAGLAEALPEGVGITGGLAADGERFERTSLLHGTEIFTGGALCIGFYGDRLRVGQGTRGGWEPFGPERLVTASRGNVLLEMDGESALDLFERYLGKHADNLPASGHLFPLSMRRQGSDSWITRTILGVDRESGSLTFGGDIPQGSTVRLMRGKVDNLLDGAEEAGRLAHMAGGEALAIIVSCVGRKMLLRQFTEEEIEAVAETLGQDVVLTGFYSYGEIASGTDGESCSLHNQTMMVTVMQESE